MTYAEYARALDQIPVTTLGELRLSEGLSLLRKTLAERQERREKLWLEWCIASGNVPRMQVSDVLRLLIPSEPADFRGYR